MTANPIRGEVPVTLDGQNYTLRPSYTAMVEIEQYVGMGIIPLTRVFLRDNQTAVQIAAVLTGGLNAARKEGADPYKLADVGAMMARTGVANSDMLSAVGAFLRNCCFGGSERPAKEDDEPGEATPPSGT